jgi:AcrR family transcriptional regulator
MNTTPADTQTQHKSSNATIDMLLTSARQQIEENGVLDLRVLDVARDANCSVTQIYRYFGSRNGLIAHALGDLYQELLDENYEAARNYLGTSGPLTVDHVMGVFISPLMLAQAPRMAVRLQILAVASTIPELEQRLTEISKRQFEKWIATIENVKSRLPAGVIFEDRAITVDLLLTMPYYARLLDREDLHGAVYVDWMRQKLFPNA